MIRIDRNVWAALLIMCSAGCAPAAEDDSAPNPGEVSPHTAAEAADDLDIESAQQLVVSGGTSCLSTSPASWGFCGAYHCKTSTTRFAWGFNSAGKCGNARSFMCAGSMHSTAQRCFVENALDANPGVAAASCIKASPGVAAARVSDACVNCFVAAEQCCFNNPSCLSACLLGQGKACDDAKRAAGCTSRLFSCAGLPTPL